MNLFFTPVCQEVNKYKMRLVFIMIKRLRFNRQNSIKQSGFTLVELIVVIVIILVLAAVLVPSVLRYVAKSQEAKCKSGRSTLATEYALAVADGRILWDEKNLDVEELQNGGILSKFACPMDGKIYALRNDDGTVVIRCGYHDDGIRDSGGGSGNSDFPGKGLVEQLKAFMEDPSSGLGGNKHNNTTVLQKFYEKNFPEDVVNKAMPKEVLTDDKINKLIDDILASGLYPENNKANIKKALEKYQGDSYALAPFILKNGEVVMYYANGEKWKSGQCHEETNLLYYNGNWYFYPKIKIDGDNSWVKSESILPNMWSNTDNIDEFIKEKNLIKIS